MNEIRVYFFIFDLVSRAQGSNLTFSSLTFQRDKMSLVANMSIMKKVSKIQPRIDFN
jgi:hypothetical protein